MSLRWIPLNDHFAALKWRLPKFMACRRLRSITDRYGTRYDNLMWSHMALNLIKGQCNLSLVVFSNLITDVSSNLACDNWVLNHLGCNMWCDSTRCWYYVHAIIGNVVRWYRILIKAHTVTNGTTNTTHQRNYSNIWQRLCNPMLYTYRLSSDRLFRQSTGKKGAMFFPKLLFV